MLFGQAEPKIGAMPVMLRLFSAANSFVPKDNSMLHSSCADLVALNEVLLFLHIPAQSAHFCFTQGDLISL